jgi:hypothetical protein
MGDASAPLRSGRHDKKAPTIVMPSGHNWDLPFDRMTTKLKTRQLLQVFEKQDVALLVIGTEARISES